MHNDETRSWKQPLATRMSFVIAGSCHITYAYLLMLCNYFKSQQSCRFHLKNALDGLMSGKNKELITSAL